MSNYDSTPTKSSEHFFKVKPTKRATKRNTQIEKYKKKGKYTSRGKRAILETSKKRNQQLILNAPRETVVEKVLNRDKMKSIALPPQLQKERIRVIKKPRN